MLDLYLVSDGRWISPKGVQSQLNVTPNQEKSDEEKEIEKRKVVVVTSKCVQKVKTIATTSKMERELSSLRG